jgi:Spy/CpxP family protein refolding chaperone
MKMTRPIATVLITGSLCGLTVFAAAQEQGGGAEKPDRKPAHERRPPMDAPGMAPLRDTLIVHALSNPEVMNRLGVTAETAASLKTALEALRAEQMRLGAEKEAAAMEQVRLLSEPAIDEDAVMAAVEKTAALQLQLAKLQVRSIIEIRKALTAPQLERARELVRERLRERFAERGGRPAEERGDRTGARGDRPRRGWWRPDAAGGGEPPAGTAVPR